MNENTNIEELDIIEKYQLAIDESRRQQQHIDELIQEIRNETRPVIVEENRKEIDRLIQEHKEYDEMTNYDFNEYYKYLNSYIELMTKKCSSFPSQKCSEILNGLIDKREALLSISRSNMDILFLIDDERKNKGKK